MNKKIQSKGTPEFQKIREMSNRDAIIYIANKYKDQILDKHFLEANEDYRTIATRFGISPSELYMYFTYILNINSLSHQFRSYDYVCGFGASKSEERNMEEKMKKDKETMAFYRTFHVWKILAFYCRYRSMKEAKMVLKKMIRFQKDKNWKRLKEIFTPLFYPDGIGSNLLVCSITKKSKRNIYIGEIDTKKILADCKDTSLSSSLLAKECIIICEDLEQKKIIDERLAGKRLIEVVCEKDKPYRNKSHRIIKIQP